MQLGGHWTRVPGWVRLPAVECQHCKIQCTMPVSPAWRPRGLLVPSCGILCVGVSDRSPWRPLPTLREQQDTGVCGPQVPCGALCPGLSTMGNSNTALQEHPRSREVGTDLEWSAVDAPRRTGRSLGVQGWNVGFPCGWSCGGVVGRAGAGVGPSAQEWREETKDRQGPWSESRWIGIRKPRSACARSPQLRSSLHRPPAPEIPSSTQGWWRLRR